MMQLLEDNREHIIVLCSTVILFYLFIYFGGAMLHSMWDLSSPTRDQTRAPCSGSMES